MLNATEKIFIIQRYYISHFNCTEVKVNFQNEFAKDPPSTAVINRLVNKFNKFGSIERVSVMKRQNQSVSLVQAYFILHPRASIRLAEKALHISRSQIHHILTDILKYKPYKTQTRQLLTDTAKIKRLHFANTFDITILDKIWFSDESYFYLHPKACNSVVWARTKPLNNFIQTPSHSAKILVWMAVSNSGIFWRIIQGNMNASTYLNLLKAEFIPYLRRRNLKQSSYFMQDGAPSHTSKTVLSYLNKQFKERIISTRYPKIFNMGIEWPPYSPDLTPLDFCIWGTLKSRIIKHKPFSLKELEMALRTEVALLDRDFILKTILNIIPRLELLKTASGAHIE